VWMGKLIHGTMERDGQWVQDTGNGTLWYNPSLSNPSHDTVGWDNFGKSTMDKMGWCNGNPKSQWTSVGNGGQPLKMAMIN